MSDEFDMSRGPGVPGSEQWNEYFRRLSERVQGLQATIMTETEELINESQRNGNGKRNSSGGGGGGDGPSSKKGKTSGGFQFGDLGGTFSSAMGGMSSCAAGAGAGSYSFSSTSSTSTSTVRLQGGGTIRGIRVSGRWTATINDYIVRANTSRPVVIDIIGRQIFIRNLQFTDDDEWEARDISPTTTTGNWELRTDGIVITINPPEASLLDQIELTKKGPGILEIQLTS